MLGVSCFHNAGVEQVYLLIPYTPTSQPTFKLNTSQPYSGSKGYNKRNTSSKLVFLLAFPFDPEDGGNMLPRTLELSPNYTVTTNKSVLFIATIFCKLNPHVPQREFSFSLICNVGSMPACISIASILPV
jgi:hypothetical protein